MAFFDLSKKSWQWIVLIFLAFIWGSSFILMKRGLEVYSHSTVAALRISIAFIFLAPFALKHFNKVDKKYWKYIVATGFLGNGIPAFLFTKAQTEITSSLSGMLNSLTPIFALIVGILFFKTQPLKIQIIGISVGFIGAVILITSKGINLDNSNLSFTLLIVLATICYAFSVNIIKSFLKEVNSIAISALAFMSIGPFTISYLFTTDFIEVTQNSSLANTSLMYIAILAIIGTAISVILFNMLIKQTSALFAASTTYIIPVFAIMWGVFDTEQINQLQLIGITIILIGVYFTKKNR